MENLPQDNKEKLEFDLDKEIDKGLSEVWFKTVQEILPGLLRDLPTNELTPDELDIYREAYSKLGELTKEKILEIRFREVDIEKEDEVENLTQTKHVPEFKKIVTGKRAPSQDEVVDQPKTAEL